jgi:FkbM family methyltransferase
MKALRLTAAGVLTVIALSGYLYLSDPAGLHRIYLCFTQSKSIATCYQGGSIDFVASIDGIRYEGNTGNGVDNDIFYYGAYEKHILYFLRDVMRTVYGNRGTFVDVGANTGQHSLFISRFASEVHAFEPWEPVLERFRRMVEFNHIKNIVIHPVALGDENSRKPFYKPSEDNLGTGSFINGFSKKNSYAGELEIQIGDDALNKAGAKTVALIKMDIEGYEKLALKGLRRSLRKDRPIVEFELSTDPKSPVSIKSKEELTALFPENYEFLVFTADDPSTGAYTLAPMDGILRFDVARQHDVIAFPIEKKKDIPLKRP